MPTIAQCLADQMKKDGKQNAWAGDPDLLLEAYEASGGNVIHPLNRIKAVLDAARRSNLFRQSGYIRACDSAGRREIRHPLFMLKEHLDAPDQDRRQHAN